MWHSVRKRLRARTVGDGGAEDGAEGKTGGGFCPETSVGLASHATRAAAWRISKKRTAGRKVWVDIVGFGASKNVE